MMMIEISVLIGGLLGLRYRVAVLLVATIVVAVAAFAYRLLAGDALGEALGLALFSVLAMQLAYLVAGLVTTALHLMPQKIGGHGGRASHIPLRADWFRQPYPARTASYLAAARRRDPSPAARAWTERKPGP